MTVTCSVVSSSEKGEESVQPAVFCLSLHSKVVTLHNATDEVKSQEAPPTEAYVTEPLPTTPSHQLQDRRRPSEVSRAAEWHQYSRAGGSNVVAGGGF